jgi:predicted MPP superfamily phosphohydrolase
MNAPDEHSEDAQALGLLERRLGRLHARQRLGIEAEHEAQVFGQGLTWFHLENVRFAPALIETALWLSGLRGRGRRNAGHVRLMENALRLPQRHAGLSGVRILHVSDPHADMSEAAVAAAVGLTAGLDYQLCVLTGDFRCKTHGPIDASMASMERLVGVLRRPVLAVLGNHDSVRMVPRLEAMGVRVLMNEAFAVEQGDARLHVAGVDDAHFYRADNIEKAAADIPSDAFSILLSHTPEIYRQAAHAEFDVMLSGHTHGGQICLPGGFPITLGARLPRRYGAGAWRHGSMQGYTSRGLGSSVVAARFNCPPEVTLHRLIAE